LVNKFFTNPKKIATAHRPKLTVAPRYNFTGIDIMPNSTLQQKGMHPEDIIAELKKRKLTMKAVSEQLDCSANSVRLVIHDKQQSKRIANHIAKLIGKKTNELWPDVYNYKARKPFRQTLKSAKAAA
jgi:lambda repressor-like predicted transcriptional regulator